MTKTSRFPALPNSADKIKEHRRVGHDPEKSGFEA